MQTDKSYLLGYPSYLFLPSFFCEVLHPLDGATPIKPYTISNSIISVSCLDTVISQALPTRSEYAVSLLFFVFCSTYEVSNYPYLLLSSLSISNA